MKTIPVYLTIAACAVSAHAAEVRLKECPAPVQTTIQENARGGHIDEIDSFAIGGKTLYVAEVELPGERDLKIHVSADGTLVKTREDAVLKDAPEAVRKAVESKLGGGKADDVDKETTGKIVTFHVEIERTGSPDLNLVIDSDGKIVSETEEAGD